MQLKQQSQSTLIQAGHKECQASCIWPQVGILWLQSNSSYQEMNPGTSSCVALTENHIQDKQLRCYSLSLRYFLKNDKSLPGHYLSLCDLFSSVTVPLLFHSLSTLTQAGHLWVYIIDSSLVHCRGTGRLLDWAFQKEEIEGERQGMMVLSQYMGTKQHKCMISHNFIHNVKSLSSPLFLQKHTQSNLWKFNQSFEQQYLLLLGYTSVTWTEVNWILKTKRNFLR